MVDSRTTPHPDPSAPADAVGVGDGEEATGGFAGTVEFLSAGWPPYRLAAAWTGSRA